MSESPNPGGDLQNLLIEVCQDDSAPIVQQQYMLLEIGEMVQVQTQNIELSSEDVAAPSPSSYQPMYQQLGLASQKCEHSGVFKLIIDMLQQQSALTASNDTLTASNNALTKSYTQLTSWIYSLFEQNMIIPGGSIKRPVERVDSEESLKSLDESAKQSEFMQLCKIYWTTKFRCWEGDGQLAALNICKDMFCLQFLLKCSWSGVSRVKFSVQDGTSKEKNSKIRFGQYENVVNLVFELPNILDNTFDIK